MYRPKRYVYFKTFCSQYRQMNKLQVLFIGGKILVNTTVLLETLQAYPAFLITICIQLLPTYKQKTLQDLIKIFSQANQSLKCLLTHQTQIPLQACDWKKKFIYDCTCMKCCTVYKTHTIQCGKYLQESLLLLYVLLKTYPKVFISRQSLLKKKLFELLYCYILGIIGG